MEKKVRIVYFPLEQKYSLWDKNHNLIKEWFRTKEGAYIWAVDNGYIVVDNFEL